MGWYRLNPNLAIYQPGDYGKINSFFWAFVYWSTDLCFWIATYTMPRIWLIYANIKKQRHYFANKGLSSQGYGFSCGHVWMWELDCEESWVLKNWWFWTVVLEKTLASPQNTHWLPLYLTYQSFSVSFAGSASCLWTLNTQIPEDSILRSLLFWYFLLDGLTQYSDFEYCLQSHTFCRLKPTYHLLDSST